MAYVGMDLHQKTTALCVVDDAGEVIERTQLRTTRAALSGWFVGRARMQVAMEAGGESPWVDRLLRGLGQEVYVVNPHRVRLIAESTLKTDTIDAEVLARLLRIDPAFLSPIRPRSETAQLGRSVLRVRRSLVEARTRFINTVRGLCRAFGYPRIRCSSEAFAERYSEHLSELPSGLRGTVEPLVSEVASLTEEIGRHDRWLRQLAKEDGTLKQLTTIPGVGPLVAFAFVLCIDDAHRFPVSRDVGAYLGLRPRLRSSGSVSRQGRITREGDPYVRTLLVQAAHALLHSKADSDLKRFGEKLSGRVGKRKAVIALARKLAVLMHRLWVTGEAYEPLHGSQARSA